MIRVKRRIRKLSLFFFGLATPLYLVAQKPLLRNYQVKDGMPSSEVYDVLQDSRGFMWFATDAGVSRFDGYHFENFTTENGLSDNTVLGMYEDRKGRVWFRTFSGKVSYYLNNAIYTIKANQCIDTMNRVPAITSMYVDQGDTLWCGLSGGSITHFKVLPGYEKVIWKMAQGFYPPAKVSFLLQIDANGFVWGGNSDQGSSTTIHLLLKNGHQVMKAKTRGCIAQAEHLTSGEWLLLSEGRELLSTSGSTMEESFPRANMIEVKKDHLGNVWVGTLRKGAFCIPAKASGELVFSCLDGYSVTGICEDREGGIWLSTLENGVYYLPNKNVRAYTHESGVSHNKILALHVGGDNKVWTGLDNGKVSLLQHDSVTGEFELTASIRTRVNKIIRYAPDKLFICSAPSFLINSSTGLVSKINNDKHGGSIYLRCFAVDEEGYGWCANHGELMKLNKTFDKVIYLGFSPGRANVICINKQDFWLGCFNGLWKYERGNFINYGKRNILLNSRIEDIKILPGGQMWLATRGRGIVVMDQGEVWQIAEKNGLASNIVRSLLVDTTQRLVWAGTNNGISKITWNDSLKYTIKNFSQKNDLLFKEVNELAMSDSFIWAATNQGLLRFNKQEEFENKIIPLIYLRNIAIDNTPIQLRENYRLRHDQNIIGINFIGLSYKNAGKISYKYKLEGLDTVWNHTINTFVQYTTLPPGNYTFKVFAINNDGVESSLPAQTHFVIESPFWETWWFNASGVITALLLIGVYFNKREEKVKRKETEKTALNKRIAGFELKALRAQMNPHFIFNSINSIQHFILKNNIDNAHRYLSKFSKLIRNVLENSKTESVAISQELDTLKLYIELESLRFNFGFRYEIIAEDHLSGFAIPSMMIQPFVENAIWHGLMPKDKPGTLIIQLFEDNGTLRCIVEDDGIGRVRSNAYKTSYHRSMGLSVTRERLEIINHLQQVHYDFKIIDKYEQGEACGTRVELHLPLLQLNPDNHA